MLHLFLYIPYNSWITIVHAVILIWFNELLWHCYWFLSSNWIFFCSHPDFHLKKKNSVQFLFFVNASFGFFFVFISFLNINWYESFRCFFFPLFVDIFFCFFCFWCCFFLIWYTLFSSHIRLQTNNFVLLINFFKWMRK